MTAIAEKYSRAIGSSHLEWRIDPGAIDTITAAGLVKGLGPLLLRLRAEYDSIAAMPGHRNMIPRLTSAADVRVRLIGMLREHGAREDDCIEMAAKLMDNWVSSNCPACSGRGLIGGYGSPQCVCNTCGGSKRRTLFWTSIQERVGERVAARMEEKAEAAARRIRRLLQQG